MCVALVHRSDSSLTSLRSSCIICVLYHVCLCSHGYLFLTRTPRPETVRGTVIESGTPLPLELFHTYLETCSDIHQIFTP